MRFFLSILLAFVLCGSRPAAFPLPRFPVESSRLALQSSRQDTILTRRHRLLPIPDKAFRIPMQPSLYSSEDTYTEETDNRPPSPEFTHSVHVKVKHAGGPVAARKRRIVKEAENLYLRAQTAQRKHDIVACLDVAVAAALEGDLCHYVPEGGGEVKEILGLLVENALKRTRRLGKSEDALKILQRVASGRYPVALSESFLDAGIGTCWNQLLRLKAQRLDKWKLRHEVHRVVDCALAMRRVQADSGLSVVSSTEDGPGASGDSHVFGYLFLRCMGRAG
uniref:Uncharacterized protein n=1 Tax=Chromera velia CCMP2878 TaxID=1169474 RepID=A0A0G4GML3_9ALVE|eukprot:Cvel_22567.t1-p1 / transcript=Cvel_22567.t1 / gene=Cvel_22567 / organism=Chromera_velia_CCMP2878 / gene_product=hypothetical protein / transcript_product=hypothetical protein / location=Cvel_scaffold2230:4087-4920(+) / protein_length=278 / sequence_SO=supercontig / SO=protein_coding / is_pseudo=false